MQKMLRGGLEPVEYCRVPHVVCQADFNTSYPNPNRINRIASEINEYLRHKNRNTKDIK